MSHAIERIVVFFETLTPQSVERFGEFYTEDAYFKDPFNEVRGIAAIQRIFSHMYVNLHEPRFVITGRVVEGEQCFLTWDFHFRFRKFSPDVRQTIRGATHLQAGAGRAHLLSPRLLGRGRGAVREAAAAGRADALVEATRQQLTRPQGMWLSMKASRADATLR